MMTRPLAAFGPTTQDDLNELAQKEVSKALRFGLVLPLKMILMNWHMTRRRKKSKHTKVLPLKMILMNWHGTAAGVPRRLRRRPTTQDDLNELARN